MTLFLVDVHGVNEVHEVHEVRKHHPEQVEVIPVRTILNYATNQVKHHGLRVPVKAVLGEIGHGFRHVIDGWNAKRTLLPAEAIGHARWFIGRRA